MNRPSPISLPTARTKGGFTVLELVIVLTIFAVIATLIGIRTGSFSFWQEEAAVRKLSETITFLHSQAVADQAYYELEFDIEAEAYRVGAIRPDEAIEQSLIDLASDAGNLSLELAAFLNPSVGETHTIIPPPSFPSLAEPVELPVGMEIVDVRTPRGLHEKQSAEERIYLLFSPRGFSEFGVIHLRLSGGAPVTVLVNPFTGTTQVFRDHRDFEWTWGREGSNES